MIRPIVGPQGVGFFSMEPLPQFADKYKYQNVGRYHNYLFTPDNYEWPVEWKDLMGPYNEQPSAKFVIDGFSPNLNKSLHIGHLRQLALARSLQGLLHSDAKFVALLGASQGVYDYAMNELRQWFDFVRYKPELYYDVLMPKDLDIVPRRLIPDDPDSLLYYGDKVGCEVWDGPKGPVIVTRSDGRSTYAFHDIAFAKKVAPTHYITGAEQKEHFESLGLGDKHLAMGLVLGGDGKKLKSRDGGTDAKAESVIQEVMANLDDTCPEKRKLAWNVLVWNFLTVARTQNVKYKPEEWTNPDAPGMYITYTYARICKALEGIETPRVVPDEMKAMKYEFEPVWDESKPENWGWEMAVDEWSPQHPDPHYDLTQADAELMGFANYYGYYLKRSIDTLDPTHVATYAHDLARRLGKAYHQEKIQGGRYGFQHAVWDAKNTLQRAMWALGMFDLKQV